MKAVKKIWKQFLQAQFGFILCCQGAILLVLSLISKYEILSNSCFLFIGLFPKFASKIKRICAN